MAEYQIVVDGFLNEPLTGRRPIETPETEINQTNVLKVVMGKAEPALADGDMDKVFKFQSEFMTAHDTAYKASLLKDMPTPPGADGNGGSDSEGVAFAKSLAQQNANTSKASSDAMSAFH